MLDDSGHTEEDTLKQINNTSHCLKMDLARYKHASFDTFLKRQVFGIQFIHDKMTLTSSRLISPTRYAFIEVRSAVIPTNYAHRCSWVKVFELLLKLKHDLIEQEKVTYLLERENVGLVKVDLTTSRLTDENTANNKKHIVEASVENGHFAVTTEPEIEQEPATIDLTKADEEETESTDTGIGTGTDVAPEVETLVPYD
ncbi:unnamed protein product [Absidia cylindrospora]